MADYNPYSLIGKTILITGASSGIGKQTAIECSRMGAAVIITARNQERLLETLSQLDNSLEQRHRLVIADLNNEEQLRKLVENTGKIDGLVLCAGRGMITPFCFATPEKVKEIFFSNFNSPIELMRQLYKNKQINKMGAIVILSSLGGTRVFSYGNSLYGASKAALDAIMKFCAKEFATRKIRVNSICPGMVETPLIHSGTLTEEQLRADTENYPLKRYGKPEDIAYLAVYLLSDASSWMTGNSINIDGGASI